MKAELRADEQENRLESRASQLAHLLDKNKSLTNEAYRSIACDWGA